MDRVQVAEQIAGIGGDGRAAAAGGGAGPEAPFDARVIDTHAGTDQHHDADDDQKRTGDPGGQAESCRTNRKNADRNAEIVRVSLKQAEGAGNVAADMLEAQSAADRCGHGKGKEAGISYSRAEPCGGTCQRHAHLLHNRHRTLSFDIVPIGPNWAEAVEHNPPVCKRVDMSA